MQAGSIRPVHTRGKSSGVAQRLTQRTDSTGRLELPHGRPLGSGRVPFDPLSLPLRKQALRDQDLNGASKATQNVPIAFRIQVHIGAGALHAKGGPLSVQFERLRARPASPLTLAHNKLLALHSSGRPAWNNSANRRMKKPECRQVLRPSIPRARASKKML